MFTIENLSYKTVTSTSEAKSEYLLITGHFFSNTLFSSVKLTRIALRALRVDAMWSGPIRSQSNTTELKLLSGHVTIDLGNMSLSLCLSSDGNEYLIAHRT